MEVLAIFDKALLLLLEILSSESFVFYFWLLKCIDKGAARERDDGDD